MNLLRLTLLLILSSVAWGSTTTSKQIDTINAAGGASLSVPSVGTKFLSDTATQTLGSGSTWNGSAIGAQYGGTGQTSLTSNNVLLGNGTSGVQFVAPGSNGNVLTSNGTTWTSAAPSGGGSGAPVRMTLAGGVTPWTTVDGHHRVRSSVTLSTVDISMGNCSSSGVVTIGIAKNGASVAQATLTASGGSTCSVEVSSLSVPFVNGDDVSVNVDTVTATGEDLSVELIGL